MIGKKSFLAVLAVSILAMLAPMPVSVSFAKKAQTAKTSSGSKKSNTNKKSSKKAPSKKSASGKQTSPKQNKKETSADVKKRQEEAQKEIKRTQQQIKENEAAVKKNLNELGKLEEDIEKGKINVEHAGAKVAALEKQIEALQTKITADEQRLSKLRDEYLKAVKKMRVKRKEQSKMAFIFSSGSFSEAMRRMRYLKEVGDWRERQTAEIGRRVESLKKEGEQLKATKSVHEKALSESVKAQNELQLQYDRQGVIVEDLKKNGEALHAHLSKKQAEVNQLRNRVSSLIAEEQRKAEAEAKAKADAEAKAQAKALAEAEAKAKSEKESDKNLADNKNAEQPKQESKPKAESQPKTENNKKQSNKAETKKTERKNSEGKKTEEISYADARGRRPRSSSSSTSSSSDATNVAKTGFESMKGSLPKPVSGSFRVTSRFGQHSLPDMPNVTYDNPGIDAEVSSGASAQAVYAGKVSGVYMLPGYSTVVILNHDGYYTVYGNLETASVKVGDTVKQGQTLGKVAADEDDSSHGIIHFELWKNRDKQDPLAWIRN